MLSVNEAKYVGGYSINIIFNNGKEGTANLEETIFNDKRPIFLRLKEKSIFQDFKVKHSTVIWFDELDLAAEYLFYLAFKDSPELQEQFKLWGYVA